MTEQTSLTDIHQTSKESSFLWKTLPEDWDLVVGTDLYEVNPSYSSESNLTYIGMSDLSTCLPTPSRSGTRQVSEHSGKIFAEDDTLFPRITPCTENGKRAIIQSLKTDLGIGSTEFIVLSPREDRLEPWYLFYLVNSHQIRDYAISRMRGSTGRQRVPYSVFRNEISLPLPPKDEQQKITSVLYNVDRAIQKTEEIIEQTKRVKQGVMQDCLLKGVDQIGHIQELDSSPVDDRKLVRLGEIMTLEYGENLPTIDRNEGEIPVYGSNGIVDRHNEPYVEKPGLIVGRKGTIGDATFSDQPFWPIDTAYYITENQTKVKLKFLYYLLNSLQLNRLNAASAIPGLNRNDAYGVKALIPSDEEQKQIVNNLESLDNLISTYQEQGKHLKVVKRGLMQDLLTGKRRTSDKDIEVLEEVKA